MAIYEDLTGRKFGRWTPLELVNRTGAAKWRCRCDCGTEKIVLARTLKNGSSLSCGCLNRETVRSRAQDLTGRRFGKLTVIQRAEETPSKDIRWECQCDCGNTYIAAGRSLTHGKRKHCGCVARKATKTVDITGQPFRMLTALYPTEKRDPRKGSVVWRCRCVCGNEVDVSYEDLLYSETISCGCRKKEVSRDLHKQLTHVAGTSIEALRNRKVRADNQTGFTGVYPYKGKYRAEIIFQRKRYPLGIYKRLEDAAEVRAEAKQLLHEGFLAHYEAWKRIADENPQWGKENPVNVHVEQDPHGRLHVSFVPDMRDMKVLESTKDIVPA